MAQLDTTQTWSTGDTVTAAKLNQMITGATVRSEIISNQVEQTAAANSSDMVVIESGGSLYKLSVGTLSQSPVWDANKIQSKAVASTAPTDGQVLIWDNANAQWSPSDVSASTLAANSVGASELADNAVDTAAIADDAVTQDKIANDSIGSDQIANDSIGSDQIASNAVGASELADDAVDTAAIVDGAITNAKLASNPTITTFTSSGTWTKPTGCNLVHVFVAAGGGGEVSKGGADGGEGAICEAWLDVSSDTTISVTVGSGGAGGAYVYSGAYSGGNGGDSSFGSKIVCTGGQGGQWNPSNGSQTDGADGTITAHTTDAAKKLVSSDFATYNYGKAGYGGGNMAAGTDGNDGIVIIRVIG